MQSASLVVKIFYCMQCVIREKYTSRVVVVQPHCFPKYVGLGFPAYNSSFISPNYWFCNMHVWTAQTILHSHCYFLWNVLSYPSFNCDMVSWIQTSWKAWVDLRLAEHRELEVRWDLKVPCNLRPPSTLPQGNTSLHTLLGCKLKARNPWPSNSYEKRFI